MILYLIGLALSAVMMLVTSEENDLVGVTFWGFLFLANAVFIAGRRNHGD